MAPSNKDTTEVVDKPSAEENSRSAQLQAYGEDFPKLDAEGPEWRKWIDAQLREQESPMRDKRLHWARHRHFRQGRQWISTRDGKTWRELDNDKTEMRLTLDLIGPALDFRLSVISEQRPGFKAEPSGFGVHAREVAEAQQRVAEYYYHKHDMQQVLQTAASNNQTDGVAFLRVFVDKNAGPQRQDVRRIAASDERFKDLVAQGYEQEGEGPEASVLLPLSEEGDIGPPGSEPHEWSEGELCTDVVLAHEAWFDKEAQTINGPIKPAKWCIIMRQRDLDSARIETGNSKLQAEQNGLSQDPILDTQDPTVTGGWQRGLPPYPTNRRSTEETTLEFFVYIPPNKAAGLEKGLWRRLVGNIIVEEADELPAGIIPLARVTDGSSDPEMYPRPVMSTWVPDQMAINMLLTKIVEHVRIWAAGRMLKQRGTTVNETFTTVSGALMEYAGARPELLQAPRLMPDVWQTLQFYVRKLEDKHGWNDLARGRVASSDAGMEDVSGRAILAAGERLERTFAPMIRRSAIGMSDWAKLIVDYARWLFETPRLIPIVGRGDLAKRLEGKDLGDESSVYVDPETLMPMPRALRQQMLFELLKGGYITAEQYNKRAPYAEVRDVYMGDMEQWERAQWVNTVLEERWFEITQGAQMDPLVQFVPEKGGIAVWWQDDCGTHKRALLEIGLDERKPLALRDLAMARHSAYDQLERAKGYPATATAPAVPPSAYPPQYVRGTPPDIAGAQAQAAQSAAAAQQNPGAAPPGQVAGAQAAPDMTGQAAAQPAQTSSPSMASR